MERIVDIGRDGQEAHAALTHNNSGHGGHNSNFRDGNTVSTMASVVGSVAGTAPVGLVGATLPAQSPGTGAAHRIAAIPGGVVTLPSGTDLSEIKVSGADLIVHLPDGSTMVIVDGAVFVPQLVIGEVQIPADNIASLLIGQEPQPAAGPPQSSGGNFAVPVGQIGDPFALGDLLPPTELRFEQRAPREIFPAIRRDSVPTVDITTPDNPGGVTDATATVSETGLPARGGEPAGSNAAANSETTTGTINYTAGDAPAVVSINGVAITTVGQTITNAIGTLTITGIGDGAIGYSYTLTDNTLAPTPQVFNVSVVDSDGDTATASLTIAIIDDAPIARADTDMVAAGSFAPESGNVLTGADTTSGAAGADTPGADGATVTGVAAGTPASATGGLDAPLAGAYGTLTLHADGSYTYARTAGTPGGVTDTFTYTLIDGDGSTSSATLTITIGDSAPTVQVPTIEGQTTVYETALPPHVGGPVGANEGVIPGDNGDPREAVSGVITFSSADGVGSVSLGGTTLAPGSLPQTVATNALGTLVVTSYAFDPATGTGTIAYTYTLVTNATSDPASSSFALVVTDQDGDTSPPASLVINIVDDVPTAVHDSAAPAEDQPVTINVLANDTPGADGVDLATGVTLVTGPAHGTVVYNGDGTFTYTPTPGAEGADSFTYQIQDGDGDVSSATVDITLAADSKPMLAAEGGTVFEAALPGGTTPDSTAETVGGPINIATGNDSVGTLVIDGIDVTSGGSVAGAHGTLVITLSGGLYSYTYTLAGPTQGDNVADDFSIAVTDSDGSTASTNLHIAIVDDVPTANPDTANAIEGATVFGDVVANDISGADGFGTPRIIGVAAGSDASSPVSGHVGTPLAGTYGTLTLNADGSYTYVSAANSVSPPDGGTDSFVYTVADGDGDVSTTTLTINIADASPRATPDGVTVNEAGLDGTGSNAAASSETASGTLADNVTGANTPFTYALVGSATGTHGTLTLNPDGTYSYTLTSPIDGVTANNGTNTVLAGDSFTYQVTDANGNTATSTITVNVVDDVPMAVGDLAQSVVEGGAAIGGNVLANDIQGADGATITSVTIDGTTVGLTAPTNVIVVPNGTYVFDQHGNWTFAPASGLNNAAPIDAAFSYTITDGDGDQSSATQPISVTDGAGPMAGAPITLTVDDQNLAAGSTPAGPDSQSGSIAFAMGSDPISTIVFANDLSQLDSTLTWMRVSATQIVGKEGATTVITLDLVRTGDTATVTATLNSNYDMHPLTGDDLKTLGSVGVVATDLDGDTATGTVNVAVSDDVPTISAVAATTGALLVDETNLGTVATADFSSLFTPHYNADGQGAVPVYTLGINPGATGLIDTATGQPVTLSVAGNVVTGSVGGLTVFTVTVDTTGHVTLDQFRAVFHADSNNPNDITGLSATNLIMLTETITDGDGDKAAATANIGGALSFRDDAPSITVAAVGEGNIILTTHDAATIGANSDAASSTAGFGGAFQISATSYGSDGAGTTSWSYALSLSGAASGLASHGVAINLYLIGGVVTGSTAATSGGVSAANTIFSIAVSGNGAVTLTQFAQIDHAGPGATSGFDSQLATLANGLVSLIGTATITDGDGDHVAASAMIDLGNNINFADDGPSIAVAGAAPVLSVDESNFAVDASASFAGAFAANFGADGNGALTYALGTTAGASGLVDTLTGQPIVLSLNGGVVEGRTTGGLLAFTVSVSAGGIVTLDESRAIIHADPNNPNDTRSLVAGLITLTATATDFDGDKASATINIGDKLVFADDAPHAVNDGVTTIEGAPASLGNVLANDGVGADQPGHVTAISGGSLGTPIVTAYGTLTILADGSYTYAPKASVASGSVDSFTYTMVDADGDPSTATLSFTFNGDANLPTAAMVSATLDDEGLAGGIPGGVGDFAGTGNEAVVSGNLGYDFGLDGAAAGGGFAFANGTGTVGTESVSYAWNANTNLLTATVTSGARTGTTLFTVSVSPVTGAYTVSLAENVLHTPGANENNAGPLVLGYTVTDSDGSTAPGSLSLTFNDDTPTLGIIQNGTASNSPAATPSVGTLHFAAGADGAGPVTITANTTGITSGGHAIVTQQVGNVLTGYADVDGSGTVNAGDTSVFTLTVDPTAGTSGQYVFDLTAPIDGNIVDTAIGGSTAFGAGPTASQILNTVGGTQSLAVVSGWLAGGSFNEAQWFNGTNQLPAGLTLSAVNGSTGGWGVANNNFTSGEFLRFDFGAPMDDFDAGGPYTPPAVALPEISYATFLLTGYSGADRIEFVIHYTDGTSANATVTGSALSSPFTTTAPIGKFIDWVDLYTPNAGGSGKISLTAVGVQNAVANSTIGFTLGLADDDGDTVSGSFTVNVADGNTASVAAPIALDLNGDGLHFLSVADGVAYDYGTGKVGTAWVGPDDGLLARDTTGKGGADGDLQVSFATGGATSDLVGVAAQYDSNHDGKLSVADTQFASFGVWQDANSNGVVDAGEFKSLAALGITSINLTSDGKVYGAAANDVTVLGQTSFTRADGSTGTVADAVFRTQTMASGTTTRNTEVAGGRGMPDAMVAAGLAATVGALLDHHVEAQAAMHDGAKVAEIVSKIAVEEPAATADHAARASLALPIDENARSAEAPAAHQHLADPANGDHLPTLHELSAPTFVRVEAPSDLAAAHVPAFQPFASHAPVVTPGVAEALFANVEALAKAAGAGNAGHAGLNGSALAHVVADAVHAQPNGPDVDTLLASLPGGHGNGSIGLAHLAPLGAGNHGFGGGMMVALDHMQAVDLAHAAHAAALAVQHG